MPTAFEEVKETYCGLSEAARLLGMNRRTLSEQLRIGTIKGEKFGYIWFVPRSEIERLIDDQPN